MQRSQIPAWRQSDSYATVQNMSPRNHRFVYIVTISVAMVTDFVDKVTFIVPMVTGIVIVIVFV